MAAGNALVLAAADESLRLGLWQACRAVPSLDAKRWRYDHAGLLMRWDEFGNGDSKVGWQLGYVVALADGGADHVDNLRAASYTALQSGV